jgi:hypothetical protein
MTNNDTGCWIDGCDCELQLMVIIFYDLYNRVRDLPFYVLVYWERFLRVIGDINGLNIELICSGIDTLYTIVVREFNLFLCLAAKISLRFLESFFLLYIPMAIIGILSKSEYCSRKLFAQFVSYPFDWTNGIFCHHRYNYLTIGCTMPSTLNTWIEIFRSFIVWDKMLEHFAVVQSLLPTLSIPDFDDIFTLI